MSLSGHILLFDGVCNLCNRGVRFVLIYDHERKIKFAALQSTSGQNILNQQDTEIKDIDTVVYIRNEKVFLRSDAVLNLLKDMGGMWKIFFVFIIIPRFIRDYLYNVIAGSRYRIFGKLDNCSVPDAETRDRFL